MEERADCFDLFVFLVSSDRCVALPLDTTGVSAVCDCGIFRSYSLTFLLCSCGTKCLGAICKLCYVVVALTTLVLFVGFVM